MIKNLDKIHSPELRRDLIRLYHESHSYFIEGLPGDRIEVSQRGLNDMINKYVLICICDGRARYDILSNRYIIDILIDYCVTHGYKPYQPLDKAIELHLFISQESIRELKLNNLIKNS